MPGANWNHLRLQLTWGNRRGSAVTAVSACTSQSSLLAARGEPRSSPRDASPRLRSRPGPAPAQSASRPRRDLAASPPPRRSGQAPARPRPAVGAPRTRPAQRPEPRRRGRPGPARAQRRPASAAAALPRDFRALLTPAGTELPRPQHGGRGGRERKGATEGGGRGAAPAPAACTWSQPGARERGQRRRFGLGLRRPSRIPAAGWTRPAGGRGLGPARRPHRGFGAGAWGGRGAQAGGGARPAPRPGVAGPSPTPPSRLAAARAAAGSREPGDVPGGWGQTPGLRSQELVWSGQLGACGSCRRPAALPPLLQTQATGAGGSSASRKSLKC